MPVSGGGKVRQRFKNEIERLAVKQTVKTVNEILIEGLSKAAVLTPVDTQNLIGSQSRITRLVPGGVLGRAGYTANYSAFVHDPRVKQNFTKATAEKEFLRKGFERDGLENIKAIIKGNYTV